MSPRVGPDFNPDDTCHSERSEESRLQKQILRFAPEKLPVWGKGFPETTNEILNAVKNLGCKSRFFASLRMTACEASERIVNNAGHIRPNSS
jgi:hypothetical protein